MHNERGEREMSKKKKNGALLIAQNLGSPHNCASCGVDNVTVVMHDSIEYVDLDNYGLDRAERKALRSAYNKQCTQRFLCKKCYESGYQLNESYLDNTGQYQYTTVPLKDWLEIKYLTVGEAAAKFS